MASRGKSTGKGESKDSYAGIPRAVMEHPDFKALTGNAPKALQILAYQFRGHNNGDLTLAERYMIERWGFKSKGTVERARDQLLERGLILQTRTGRFTNPGGQCALYALTWLPINECPNKRLEVAPTNTPARIFARELADLRNNKTPAPDTG